jgi:hypothetical protein
LVNLQLAKWVIFGKKREKKNDVIFKIV